MTAHFRIYIYIYTTINPYLAFTLILPLRFTLPTEPFNKT